MKILQIIQKKQLRGAELFACNLSNHLMAAGHEVKMLSIMSGEASLPYRGEVLSLKRPSSIRIIDVMGWYQLAKIIDAFDPDVVQANAGDTLKYASVSKLLFRWKAPIIFRNASVMSRYIKSLSAKQRNAFLFKRVTHVISVSEKSRQDFVALYPFMRGKVEVVPVGVELTGLTKQERGDKPYLLHVGGFTFEKNHGGLLSIFKMTQRFFPDLELWMVGDGPLRKSIEEKARALGIDERVRFLGYQSNVFPLMQEAQALMLPSIIEGLPGVILEAMYCRTPVVAYDVGGIAEVVKSGETGWLVKAGDEEGFVKAVQEVLNATNLDEIKANAYDLVTREYDNRVIARRFLEVYKKLIIDN